MRVLRHYAQQDEAARKYYRRILDGARLAAAVDVGWAGSGALGIARADAQMGDPL